MKKIFTLFVLLLMSITAWGNSDLFNQHNNSLSISAADGIKKTNNQYIKKLFSIQYSQPNEVFRLAGRINVEGSYAQGENNLYDTAAIGLSQDLLLLETRYAYFGIGGGIYFRQIITPNLGSKFAFGAKTFLGHKLTDYLGIEVYMNHFSNGDLAKPNIGEEYVGISLIGYY